MDGQDGHGGDYIIITSEHHFFFFYSVFRLQQQSKSSSPLSLYQFNFNRHRDQFNSDHHAFSFDDIMSSRHGNEL
jgi:hypothetical protein